MRAGPAALLLAFAAPAAEEKPFPPTDRSQILREEGIVYLVEGRVVIPRGVEISCQKNIYFRAKGKDPAVIAVEGTFSAKGATSREIIFEGVTVEPGTSFEEIQIDSCIFRKGGGVATPKGGTAEGKLVLQSTSFRDKAKCDLAMTGSSFQFLDSDTTGPLRIRGTPGKDGSNRLKGVVRGSKTYGIEAIGVGDLTVRLSGLRSDPLLFRDCAVLCLDGCKVEGKELRMEQTKAGGFAGTRVMKCDLYPKALQFRAPADPKKGDPLVLDKCWFEGVVDAKGIGERIRDGADDPGNNVKVSFLNPQERPHELAGTLNR